MFRKIQVLFLSMAFLTTAAYAKPLAHDLSPRTKTNSAIRSLILPGWGQQFNGQSAKGWIISGAVLLTAAGACYQHRKSEDTYADYEKLGAKDSVLYDDYETQSGQALSASLLCAGIWIYGIVDAYIFGGESSDSTSRAPAVRLSSAGGRTGIVYSKRF